MSVRELSRDEVRELDRRAVDEFHMPSIVLMENAGHAAAQWLIELGIRGRVVICCGKGNNGGDGFVMARHLDAGGFQVHVLYTCDTREIAEDARTNFLILKASRIPAETWQPGCANAANDELLRHADWVVDALLGTGVRGEPREPIRSAIAILNRCPAPKFAIDVPSGLDADSGEPCGEVVRASHTATFVARKRGFANRQSTAFTGIVRTFDIGIPRALLDQYRG